MVRYWRWLMPGLHLKRWLLLFAAGVFLAGFGLSLLFRGGAMYASLESWLRQVTVESGLRIPAWLVGIIATAAGVAVAFTAQYLLVRSIIQTLYPGARGVAERFYQRRRLDRGPKVVAVGGGSGLPAVLRGMKEYTANISAVVTVADDGGSSGRLRSQFGILPPGDIRNCLVALSDAEPLMEKLFQYRFQQGEGLEGHSFGNLFILALTETTGDFYRAVQQSSQVLAVRGRVIPSTLDHVVLKAELQDGAVVVGESAIGRTGRPPRRIWLEPAEPRPVEDALQAIAEADLIILGPGSLFTSIIPNLLVPGMAEAIRRSPALKIYVCNIMTQPGETPGFTAADHVRAILDHTGPGLIDCCLVNTGPIDESILRRYAEQGAEPVRVDEAELRRLGVEVVKADLVDRVRVTSDHQSAELVRHHPGRLARAISQLALSRPLRPDRLPWEFLWLRQRLAEMSAGEGKEA